MNAPLLNKVLELLYNFSIFPFHSLQRKLDLLNQANIYTEPFLATGLRVLSTLNFEKRAI